MKTADSLFQKPQMIDLSRLTSSVFGALVQEAQLAACLANSAFSPLCQRPHSKKLEGPDVFAQAGPLRKVQLGSKRQPPLNF